VADASLVGQLLDERYRVLQLLGSGGMGEVYLAEHVGLGRQDALKVLRSDFVGDGEFVVRFRREARAINRLNHDNIVSVHDFGRLSDGRYYVAMEFIAGDRLDSVLSREGMLPAPRAVSILLQLADAVHHAHTHGVVHRDLKPENLLLTKWRGRNDLLKVLDFGVAKIVTGDVSESAVVSKQDRIYGTPLWMAPEQFGGTVSDPRVDIYSIGCIGYALLVGQPPFSGTMLNLMQQHVMATPDRPSARRRLGSVPRELDDIVLRCLAKKPSERFQTARDLYLALERLQTTGSEPAAMSNRRRHTARSLNIKLSDFEDVGEATIERPRMQTAGMAATEPLSRELLATGPMQQLLLSLGQALCDLDCGHSALAVALSKVRELDEDLRSLDAQQEAIDALADDLEQCARAKKASLRFALGELHYQRARESEGGRAPNPTLERRLDALQQHIAGVDAEFEPVLQLGLDQSISLAARRATVEDGRVEAFDELRRAVYELAGQFREHPAVATLYGRLQVLPLR
jgi:serine/threonine protein kinase